MAARSAIAAGRGSSVLETDPAGHRPPEVCSKLVIATSPTSVRGAAFGLQPVLTQTAWFRPHNRSEELDGLYLVGAGTHPGAGMPGVISSAKVLDEVVPDPAQVA